MRRWRFSVLGLVVLVAGFGAVALTSSGRSDLTHAVSALGAAKPGWLLVAGAAFAAALLCSAAAWTAGLGACGGTPKYVDVAARYAVGSLVNSAAPAHVGGAVRLGLLSRTLSGPDPLLRACGVAGAIGAVRVVAFGGLVVAAASVGRAPWWPAPLLVVAAAAVFLVCIRTSTRVSGRVAAVLETFRCPRTGVLVLACAGSASLLRIAGTVAVVAAMGISQPLIIAIVLLAAMALAGLLPLTPGNIGAGAGAAVIALHGSGVGTGTALALGLALQGAEMVTSLALGSAGAAVHSAPGTRLRRVSFALAGVAVVAVAATLGMATADLV